MSPSLYLKDQPKKYLLLVKKDPYRGVVNPYFLKLQQKNVVAGENCPYVTVIEEHWGAGGDTGELKILVYEIFLIKSMS